MAIKYRLLKSPDGEYIAQKRILISATEQWGNPMYALRDGITYYEYTWEPFIDLSDCESQMEASLKMQMAIRNLNRHIPLAEFDEDGNPA